MQTTELFVEQVLIGILVLLGGVMVISPESLGSIREITLGEGALVLGIGYVIGIIYDRVGDTLLEDLECHHRLVVGLREWGASCTRTGTAATSHPAADPFPEDALRLRILDHDNLNAYANYLRSRIRLTRAVATLLPVFGVALVLRLAEPATAGRLRMPLLVLLGFLYATPFLAALLRRKGLRTDDLTLAKEYGEYRARIRYDDVARAPRGGDMVLLLHSTAGLCVVLFSVLAAVFVLIAGGRELALLPVGALLAVLIAGWSWWRITRTFYTLLATVHRVSVP